MNISQIRRQTPGTDHVIHFNNAGASLMSQGVLNAVTEYLQEEAMLGGYETARKYKPQLEAVYSSIAQLINAEPSEIAILENATAAWNMAFFSIDFNAGDRILTSASEYASNYINYLKMQEDVDVSVEVIPTDTYGQASVNALTRMMDEQVRLISITHIPTNSGLVNPAEKIGSIARHYNCLYLLDACQSIGQYPVDVESIGCDLLSATGRKYLRGPRGTGFLYAKKTIVKDLHPPFLDLHSAEWTDKNSYHIRNDARRFENWEASYAGILGLNTAVRYALDIGMDNIWKRIRQLANTLREKLSSVPGVTVHDIGNLQCGIVSFAVENYAAEQVQQTLQEDHISVSVTTKSSTRIDMEQRSLEELVRASVHYYNTDEEIDKLADALRKF